MRVEEEALFQEWRTSLDKPETFVSDGVVDETAYRSSNLKLLFLLKEVNDLGGGGWDLRAILYDYLSFGRIPTWLNICRWIKGIRAIPTDLEWETELKDINVKDREELLRSIAVMNLKKTPGGHTTVVDNFNDAVERDRKFIKRQIKIYAPNLIICCGSIIGDAIEGIFPEEIHWEATSRGVWFSQFIEGSTLIYFSHPEARVSSNFLHYALMDTIKSLPSPTLKRE